MTSHFTGTTKNRRWNHGKQRLKRCVFRRLRKTGSEDADVIDVRRQTVPNTCGNDRKSTIADGRQPRTVDN